MLEIQNLTHTYPNGTKALDNVSLSIPKGMFGLLGPNGAGKSSLMRTIATLQQPSSGRISLDGVDVLKRPDEIRKVLGYLPQDFGVYPRGSAQQLLDHIAVLKGLTNKNERIEIVDSLLQQSNLYEHRHKRLATFSGGMRQRFGIAQALIGNPKLIIVDEPTAGLDPTERNRFYNLLSEIGEDVVVILSTHIVSDIAELCPKMAILAKGKIVSMGTPSDLMHSLANNIWEKQIDKSKLALYSKNQKVISHHFNAGKLKIRVSSEQSPGEGFQATDATLEDVYFSTLASTSPALCA